MKNIRFLDEVETRFTHDEDKPPLLLNDVAVKGVRAQAYGIDQTTQKGGALCKVPRDAELSVPDADADRLIELGLAEAMLPPAKADAKKG